MTLTYIAKEHALLKPDGSLLKRLSCPLEKRWQDLMPSPDRDDVRKCSSCEKDVISLVDKDESAIIALLSADEKPCVHLEYSHPAVTVVGDVTAAWEGNGRVRSCTYRVIKTARTIEAMNAALSQGLRPLVKKVETNPELRRTCMLIQNKTSGEVKRTRIDGRREKYDETQWNVVVSDLQINESPKSQIAAYLVPLDLETGEHVVLEDLIAEIVAVSYSGRGGFYATRQDCAEAVWDGVDFVLDESSLVGLSVTG
jgi:hypothetical protein